MGYTLQFSNIPAWLFYRPTILMKSLWRHDGGGNSSVVLYSKTSRIFAKHFCAEFRQIPFLSGDLCHQVPNAIVGFSCSATAPCWVCAGAREDLTT
jgi:hypothetical protein